MTARVRLELEVDTATDGVAIPVSALLSGPSGEFFVWVYDPGDSQVERRAVRVGTPVPGGITIDSGLAEGDLVVTAGANQLSDGMAIRPLGEPASRL
jgi:multidrug efflux pump subunit AcrA (membrane-fusion protein)